MRLLAMLGLLILGTVVSAAHWGYDEANGPATWEATYPDCGGKFQSPIDIDPEAAIKTKDFFITTDQPRPSWDCYDKLPKTMTVTNNGHSLSLTGNATGNWTTTPTLRLDGKVFALDAVHFHWGKSNSEGSEHSIAGRRYPLEMHAVHKRIDTNGTVATPLEIIVVTQLFQVSEETNRDLQKVVWSAPQVKLAGASISIQPFQWSKLIESFTGEFYKYQGSLTTPPCTEAATFFIRDKIFKVSDSQMELLRILQNEETEEISGNFRPTQLKNGRPVYYIGPESLLSKILRFFKW